MAKFTISNGQRVQDQNLPLVGWNMSAAKYYSEPYFIDVMKQAGGWYSTSYDKPGLFAAAGYTDAAGNLIGIPPGDGYAECSIFSQKGSAAPTPLVVATARNYWSSTFKVSADDPIAALTFSASGGATISTTPIDAYSMMLTITFSGGGFISVKCNSAPMRNIKMVDQAYVTEYNNGQYWYPRIVSDIAGAGFIRAMDLCETNDSTWAEWTDRTKLTDQFWAPGAPYEAIAQLANLANCHLWANVPLLASDDYATKFGQLFANQLSPSLMLLAEFSNERWNSQFKAYTQSVAAAAAYFGVADGSGNYLWLEWGRKRSDEVMALIKAAFGTSARWRFRGILGAHSGGNTSTTIALDAPTWKAKDPVNWVPPDRNHSFIAITGYYGGAWCTDDPNAAANTTSVMNGIATSIADGVAAFKTIMQGFSNNAANNYSSLVSLIGNYNLTPCIYEHNCSAVTAGCAKNTTFYPNGSSKAAIPEYYQVMEDFYYSADKGAMDVQQLQAAYDAGFAMFCLFANHGVLSDSGLWGYRPVAGYQSDALAAVNTWLSSHPRTFNI